MRRIDKLLFYHRTESKEFQSSYPQMSYNSGLFDLFLGPLNHFISFHTQIYVFDLKVAAFRKEAITSHQFSRLYFITS